MYKVICDGVLLYHDQLESLQIFNASVELELNKTGSFIFTIYPDHPHYTQIKKLKSIITVWQDDFLLFRGRVLNDEMGFYNEMTVTCEGDMAFLLDSIQRPGEYSGSIQDVVTWLIDRHNMQVEENKHFSPGILPTSGALSIILDEHTTTLEAAQKAVFVQFGGYARTRHENGVNYLDYITDNNVLAPQVITFGKNLMELKRIRKGEEIASVVVPLGAKIEGTENRLTIASVNGGLDYLQDQNAIAQYGWIVKQAIFEDITEPEALKRKGQAYLAELVNGVESVELSAADLATVDRSVESFHLGTMVQVTSGPHGLNQRFLVSKLSINLLDPAANKLTLGGIVEPFTASAAANMSKNGKDGKNGNDGEDATVLRIDSSRGTVFKNSAISTTLTVAIYHGDARITNRAMLTESFGAAARLEWSWQRMDETTFGIISADDSRLHDDGFTLILTPADIDTKATFICKLIL